MAANRTTRRGNGASNGTGWGGPAKGASTSRLAPKGDAYSDAVRALSKDPGHMEAKAEVLAEMLAVQIQVARTGDAETVRVMAADKVMDRLGGKPTQAVDHTSIGERIGYVIQAPPVSETADEWLAQHKPN